MHPIDMICDPLSDSLGAFQDAFVHALMRPAEAPLLEVAALTAQPGFAVYRNTVMKGCIDALHANFPAVAQLVGDEWFRAAAAVYIRGSPPANPTLLHYGKTFPEFLARFEPAADLPYLADVARLDCYWNEAHAARDECVLAPGAIAGLPPAALAALALRPHAAARWAWFPRTPAYTIWSRNRTQEALDEPLDWTPEGALLVRPGDAVRWIACDRPSCAFLDACAAGGTLAVAADAALAVDASADLARVMFTLLGAGAFRAMNSCQEARP
jgi:hypothetical protein